MALETAPANANNAFTRNHTETVTILSGATTSDEFIIGGRGVVTIHLPAVSAAYFSYLVKINPGDTAVVLVDDSNSTLTFPRGSSATVTTARVYQEPRLSGVYSVQIVSSASQGSDRVIGISARGQNPIPTITDIEATIGSITGTVTANQGTAGAQPWPVKIDQTTPGTTNGVVVNSGSLTTLSTATAATETGVGASASSVTILASNAARKGCLVTNDIGSATLYLRFSATAATTASGGYSVILTPGQSYEMGPNIYSGAITGIWSAATGFANVTEY